MRSLTESKTAALIAGLALAGGLAGCAATTDDGPDPNAVDPAPPSPSATADSGSGTDTGSGSYADGTYTESGDYQAPSGIWTYWRDRDASAVFACDQYDTNELKNAYFGTACRDAGKNIDSTVPAPKNR